MEGLIIGTTALHLGFDIATLMYAISSTFPGFMW
jgi:hypothetical protein